MAEPPTSNQVRSKSTAESGKNVPQKWNGFAIKLTTLVNFLMFQSQSIYKYFTYDKTRTEFLDLNQSTIAVTFSK